MDTPCQFHVSMAQVYPLALKTLYLNQDLMFSCFITLKRSTVSIACTFFFTQLYVKQTERDEIKEVYKYFNVVYDVYYLFSSLLTPVFIFLFLSVIHSSQCAIALKLNSKHVAK